MTEQQDPPKNDLLDETGLDTPEVEKGLSPVASIASKNIMAIAAGAAVVILMVMRVLFGTKEPEAPKEPEVRRPVEVVRPSRPLALEIPSIPELPEPPAITAPEPEIKPVAPPPNQVAPAAPVSPPPIETKPAVPADTNPVRRATEAVSVPPVQIRPAISPERMKAGMMVYGQAAPGQENMLNPATELSHDFNPGVTSADRVRVTKAGDMSATIVQGKIIDAILETAINTDLAGTIRAIVSRDIYSESGKNILIPRGSRVIGNYDASNIAYGQKRIAIVWQRIIRPDGIDIKVDSPAIDQIGRAGAEGFINNKYFETIANAILVSTVNVLWTDFFDRVYGSGNDATTTTTTGADGATTTSSSTSSATDEAIKDASNNISDALGEVATKSSASVRPTFTIDQGERIKIFVNRDLVFPYSVSSGTKILK